MKQTFDIRGGPEAGRAHLPLLRASMAHAGLDGVYVPHEDEYQNEYLPEANERLAWVSGFTGSAGAALIFTDRAILFADGRYTLQAADQVDGDLFEHAGLPEPGPFGWLAQQKMPGMVIGYDPKLMSPNAVKEFKAAAGAAGAVLRSLETNPLDVAWSDRPAQPDARIRLHAIEHAGVSSADKRSRLGGALASSGADATVVTAPASIAWLFNLRGGDVACTPLPLARAILFADGTSDLFVDLNKIDDSVRDGLGNEVRLRDLTELEAGLGELAGKTVQLDPAMASAWFFDCVGAAGASIVEAMDICALPKARKNAAEIAGAQAAHRRDGAALVRFLHWLATEAQSGEVTEIDAVTKLESFRDATGALNDLSFETISGAGPNGAVVHYRVSTATNRKLERGSLFLVDSGGQYDDGTTDVTRTVPIGEATAEMARHYTLVLKGHIALSVIRFPPGTTGTHIDVIARHALWQQGFDYEHGTGHGVGSYLGVHEGPQRIAKPWNAIALEPGMIVSNEPGYYKTGAYGIRIENLQFVTEPAAITGGDIDMLGFETLTLAPLARDLINLDLLSADERAWVDAYHTRVLDEIGPLVPEGTVRDWLTAQCAALG